MKMTDVRNSYSLCCVSYVCFPSGAMLDGAHAHPHGREAFLLPGLQQTLPTEAATYRAPEEVP